MAPTERRDFTTTTTTGAVCSPVIYLSSSMDEMDAEMTRAQVAVEAFYAACVTCGILGLYLIEGKR